MLGGQIGGLFFRSGISDEAVLTFIFLPDTITTDIKNKGELP